MTEPSQIEAQRIKELDAEVAAVYNQWRTDLAVITACRDAEVQAIFAEFRKEGK